MNIYTHIIPKLMTDERVDYLIDLFDSIKNSNKIILSFERNVVISAAGMALFCNFIDSLCESKCEIEITNIDNKNTQHIRIVKLVEDVKSTSHFLAEDKYQFENESSINWFKVSSIAPEFIEKMNRKFYKILDEDKIWTV